MSYQLRLASAFRYPAHEYKFVREEEGVSCACGHKIKAAFIIRHDLGHEFPLGSECINTYPEIEGVRKSVQAHIAAKEAAAKLHQEHLLNTELVEITAEIESIRMELRQETLNGVRLPYDLWCVVSGRTNSGIHKLKSLKGKVKRAREFLNYLNKNKSNRD